MTCVYRPMIKTNDPISSPRGEGQLVHGFWVLEPTKDVRRMSSSLVLIIEEKRVSFRFDVGQVYTDHVTWPVIADGTGQFQGKTHIELYVRSKRRRMMMEWFHFQEASFGGLKSLDCSGFGLFLSRRLDAGHHRLVEPITSHC